ncbi:MAG: hypothetical protein IPH93_10250 [Saprospiraceae bacterium]|nr:hypothetical protein [Saprospiraceae bacterium]MBK7812429.1 hypothetical protein [Saprospiraceae bacterium]MBK9632346.1 hypothetical protein [Saprospiraceae bacterium]
MNQENISKKYCVNKSKPFKKCDGKCRLSLLLKKYDAQNVPMQNQEKNLVWSEIPFFEIPNSSDIGFIDIQHSLKKSIITYQFGYKYESTQSCFHPPEVI